MHELVEGIYALCIINVLLEQMHAGSSFQGVIHFAMVIQIMQLALNMLQTIF